jgi:cobalt-precorrin 5A hydrolase
MARGETMTQTVAIGVGCRAGIGADEIIAAVEATLDEAGLAVRPVLMATIQDKRGEPGLALAAARLGLVLVFLPRDVLAAASAAAVTRSDRVVALHGVPSVAETAALAAAGPEARLLVPRRVQGGVTCAIATGRAP